MKTPHNIVLVCTNDILGGAAVVTYRLMKALQSLGLKASMLVMNKFSDDPDVHVVGWKPGRRIRFIAERAYIFAHNGFNRRDLFKVSVANTGYDLSKHQLIKEADAIILSWVNQGMLSLSDIKRLGKLGKPIAWIMHDMWCFTGACHHALGCDGFKHQCGHCRYFYGGKHKTDLSSRGLIAKSSLYRSLPRLRMVAVSSWLRDQARNSSVLNSRDVAQIPNAFPINNFYINPRGIKLPEGIDTHRKLIIMGAARLDDPIKDFPLAIDALNSLSRAHPEVMSDCQLILYGNLRDPGILGKLKFPHIHLGTIHDRNLLRELFSISKIVLSTSVFETLPGTIIEGMAAGCIAVATGNGGQRDIIEDGNTGFIAESNADSIAIAIYKALYATPTHSRQIQHDSIESRFDGKIIAQRIIKLLEE